MWWAIFSALFKSRQTCFGEPPKHGLHYLHSSDELRLVFRTVEVEQFGAYWEADWGQERATLKSIRGILVLYAGSCLNRK